MKIEDIKEQKMISTEIKKLNSLTNLLYVAITLIIIVFAVQGISIYLMQQGKLSSVSNSSVTAEDINIIRDDIKEVKKAVHYRYFNLTNSLMDIHNVKLETHQGHIVK